MGRGRNSKYLETCYNNAPQMIKNLPSETLKYLLDLYNKIWEEGFLPEWVKSATIKSLLKKRKDPKDGRGYRPLALINNLCRTFKRMTNKRLVWNLEKGKNIDFKQFGFIRKEAK